ncbi:uncharacterized protein LOC119281049 [Triticum dicoccoides]|uniref:uncharacterized protein LOC119281049 n=1 Tax=Triticum dicoccoides TaxID=85692 RepID=UPI000E791BBD|nr:uncharacterized protein LOC119281049 [Triticum dicoccoides]
MVKLATARDCRAYSLGATGGETSRNRRWEYINAGVYVFAAVLLLAGFLAQLWSWAVSTKAGLAVAVVGLLGVLAVNAHDLLAHVAGVDYNLGLAGLDTQFVLVELAAPAVQLAGAALTLVALILFEIQMERGHRRGLEKHGLNLLIAGPALWCLGSIHNMCQVYERANGHVQILQKSVHIPFLLGSTLFFIGGVVNRNDVHGHSSHSFTLLGRSWAWYCLFGSLLFLAGGLLNLLKVFKMQQMGGRGLEKLRGGAQERLSREREGKVPLILEEGRRGKHGGNVGDTWAPPAPRYEPRAPPVPPPPEGSYKDAVVSGGN